MLREKLLKFADYIERSPKVKNFNLSHGCGCVTAQCAIRAGCKPVYGQQVFAETFHVSSDIAAQIYGGEGLSWNQMQVCTRKQAARMLRRLARTGAVKYVA